MTTAFIMACIPADISDLPEIDIPLPKPTTLYTLIKCENPYCAQDMWIGPRQLARATELILEHIDVFKFCYLCAIKVQAMMGQTELLNLGGGAGVEGTVRS